MEKFIRRKEYTKEEMEAIRQELEYLKTEAWKRGGTDSEIPFIMNLLIQIKDKTINHDNLDDNLKEARRRVLGMQDDN
mgnify:CR=1 FL=1